LRYRLDRSDWQQETIQEDHILTPQSDCANTITPNHHDIDHRTESPLLYPPVSPSLTNSLEGSIVENLGGTGSSVGLKRKASTINYLRENNKKYRSKIAPDETPTDPQATVPIYPYLEQEFLEDGEPGTEDSNEDYNVHLSATSPDVTQPNAVKDWFPVVETIQIPPLISPLISRRTFSVLSLLGITLPPLQERNFMAHRNYFTKPLFTDDQLNLIRRAANFFTFGWREASFVLNMTLVFAHRSITQQSDSIPKLLRACIDHARYKEELETVCVLTIHELDRLSESHNNKLTRFLLQLILMEANASLLLFNVTQYKTTLHIASHTFYDLKALRTYLHKLPPENLQLDCSDFNPIDSYFRNHGQMLFTDSGTDSALETSYNRIQNEGLKWFLQEFLHYKPYNSGSARIEVINQNIRDCLSWCLTKFAQLSELKGASLLSNQSSNLKKSSELSCIYWTLCAQLERHSGTIKCPWYSWLLPSRAAVIAMSITEFLSKITYLILEVSQLDAASSRYYRTFTSKSFRLINRAIEGARTLIGLSQEDLVKRFLCYQHQQHSDNFSHSAVMSAFDEVYSTVDQSSEIKPQRSSRFSTLAPSLSSSSVSNMRLSTVPLAGRLSFSAFSRLSTRSRSTSNVDRLSNSMNSLTMFEQ
jgi:hypothetical protein